MTFQSVWWYPNYVEYGAGVKEARTWPTVMEQYRRPDALYDLRYYDLPTEQYAAKLYYNKPRLGMPVYRGTFRDKPQTISRYYPEGLPGDKPVGYHGRVYYEDGPPQFKYQGPRKDDLYWLERAPYLPSFSANEKSRSSQNPLQTSCSSSRQSSATKFQHPACTPTGQSNNFTCNTQKH